MFVGPHSEETKRKISKTQKGNKYCIGRKLSEKTKKKISEAHKGKKLPEDIKDKIRIAVSGKNNHFYGKHHTQESINKIRQSKIGKQHSKETKRKMSEQRMKGDNPNWRGGKSFEPYSSEFTEDLKMKIRIRDEYKCQFCGCFAKTVHHINYNKKDTRDRNLITLCIQHNATANGERKKWEHFYTILNHLRGV